MFNRAADYVEEMAPRTMMLFGVVLFVALCALLAATG